MNRILTLIVVLVASAAGCSSSQTPSQPPLEVEESARPAVDHDALKRAPDGFQEVNVLQTIVTADGYAVLLQDKEESHITPIFVGETNAMAIHLRMERRRYERPLTHDLLDDMLKRLGVEVVKVHIDGLKSGVFVGTVFVISEGELLEFDARSSDAIALAVGNEVPIFIADEVVEKAGISRVEMEKKLKSEPGEDPETITEPL